jgi:ABC-type Fe3+-hydroxamate transport system substrate-binding protein
VALSRRFFSALVLLLACGLPLAQAEPPLRDADGVAFTAALPARRIVTLAPHLTDTLLALGARDRLAGVADDHDQRGAHERSLSGLPVVADAASINYERVLALQPDLVLAWGGGTPRAWIAQLRRQGLPVFVVDARNLDDIAREVELLGTLSGRLDAARPQAAAIRAQIARLQQEFGAGPRLRYFHQVWRQPLYSLGANHLLSQALALCGADNIVPPGPVAAPLVSPEFVLRENPDAILFAPDDTDASRAYWSRFHTLAAAQRQQWLPLADKRLTRPGAGMLSAVAPVCAQIASWRKRAGSEAR